MSVAYGSVYTSSSGNSSLRVCCNYTITTNSSTGVKTVKYYYYLEVTKGDFSGSKGYVSWNPSESFTLNGTGIYQKSSTYTLTIQPGASKKSIPEASGGYLNYTERRSTVDAISVSSTATYAVKYNANGGSGAPDNQTKVSGVTLTLSSAKPKRTGYDFVGWGTSSTATTAKYAAGAKYKNNAAITLYAVWRLKTYPISYDANGGTGAPAAQTKSYGINIILSNTIPIRKGYKFLGWGTSVADVNATYLPGAVYSNNVAIILYAIWKKVNNMALNSSGITKKGKPWINGKSGTPWINVDGVWKKGE